jgi:plastocyanin
VAGAPAPRRGQRGPPGAPPAATARTSPGKGATFTITIADFAFDPNCFTASASQGITIVNQDDADHTFTIPDTQVDVPIAAGETFNGESGAVEPGTYDFLCTIHPTMTGQVTVVA